MIQPKSLEAKKVNILGVRGGVIESICKPADTVSYSHILRVKIADSNFMASGRFKFHNHALAPRITPCCKKEADGGCDGVDDKHQPRTAAHDPEGAKGPGHSEDTYGL